jgi:hypothetical protein
MLYKSSILAAIFVLLSIGNAIAADLLNIENSTADQQSELIVNAPDLKLNTTTKNSASIAKARLLQIANTEITTTAELNISPAESSANIAKTRLHNLVAKESSTSDRLSIADSSIKNQINNTAHIISPSSTKATQISNDTLNPNNLIDSNTTPVNNNVLSQQTKQHSIVSANTELNDIKQWQINKFVVINDILLAPTPALTISQAPERLPDSSIPTTSTIETQKPAITNPTTPVIGTQKPVITNPTTLIIGTQKPVIAKPPAPTIEAQKPEPAPQNNEPKKWAVGVHTQLSTTGFVGVDAGYKFSPNLHARLGLNTIGFNVDYTSQGIDYKSKFNPTNVHLLGDFFPFGGGLRLTGGLVFQSNQFNATGTPNSSALPGGVPTQISLGGTTYNISDVGTVSSEGSFSNSVAPYLGIGFGTPISPGLGFNFDAGVMFAGSANVKLRANIPSSVPAALQTQIRNSLADQERRTNNDIGGFNVYPVVSIGISYAF